MSFTLNNIEFFIVILVRISAFVYTAPFFSFRNVPIMVKAGLSFFLSLIVFQMVDISQFSYQGTIGYAELILKEAIVGILLGYVCNICTYILNFAGQLIDMEIGFSMVSLFDPLTNLEVTITGNYYNYIVMLLLMVSNMHYYVTKAIIDSFQYIPLGKVVLEDDIYKVLLKFLTNYFIIGFRIVLPIFACMLVIDIVLGVLAKMAPQMNMFVVGFQLKIFVGLFVLLFIVTTLPSVSNFIFDEMKNNVTLIIEKLAPK